MKVNDLLEWGRIVKGVNTTVDVDPNEIKTQAAKFGNTVDRDGRPPTLSKKIKGKSTNVLFNLGLSESRIHQLEASYEGNLGLMELFKFFNSAPPSMVEKVKELIKDKRDKEVWKIVQNYTQTKLVGKDFEESESQSCPRTRASSCQCESVNKITEADETLTAVCVLEHSDKVKGTILLKQQPGKPTLIVGKITGLSPGEHGFHIHEFGDLSNGCESAGKHYNPDGIDHGDLDEGHVGDLGNVTADENGIADIKIVAKRIDLAGDRSVVGRAIVIHEDPDDLGKGGDDESLKTGNAGNRLACGVITLKETVNENFVEGEFRANDIEEFKPSNKALNNLKSKYLPDWEMLDHRILQAKYVADDHRAAVAFIKIINNLSEQMDHFCEVTQDVAEVTVKTTTFDVKGLTILDFQIAMVIDRFASDVGIKQVPMSGNFGMHENFADGKVKGKSRPGRVKRAGASCNGSVTDLRKRAKNSSGEKSKMYHWCANMKSGRKK